MPKPKLEDRMEWAKDFSVTSLKFIGTCELLGAMGLIFPMSLHILPILTPVAASGLVLVIIMAMRIHFRRKEYNEIGINVLLMVLAMLIAVIRF